VVISSKLNGAKIKQMKEQDNNNDIPNVIMRYKCSGHGFGVPLMPLVVVAWLNGHETPNYLRVKALVWG
jgi:hypothetical protein